MSSMQYYNVWGMKKTDMIYSAKSEPTASPKFINLKDKADGYL